MTIGDALKQRILILDGAMGTMIQGYHLSEKDFRGDSFIDWPGQLAGNNDVLNITRPDVICDIHRRYLVAGADIISTNTFNAQRISQADYGMQDYAADMARQGASLARKLADEFSTDGRVCYVAGSVGPTNKTCSMSPDVSNPAARDIDYDQMFAAYLEQMMALLEGGIDVFLIETVFDTLNAKAALAAAMAAMEQKKRAVPILVSATISDLAGRTLSGQTLEAFLASISSFPVLAVGLNCSFGPDQMLPFLRQLAQKAPYYIMAYPNAGLPNSMGLYDETADSMAPKIKRFIDEGLVNIVGGCCGTTDAFINRYGKVAAGAVPHKVVERPNYLRLSGIEVLNVTKEVNFVNVGERCNVAGSRKFLRLINEKKTDEAVGIARKQVNDGALVIDVNMDDALLDAKEEMKLFLNAIAAEPDIASVPVMVDSSKWEVIVQGLKCLQGKGIVNSISLKEGEQAFLDKAKQIMRLGAAVVVMCFDEKGQATSFERRIEIAERSYRLLTEKVGISPLDIIIDPNILAVATGMEEHDAYAADFIKATRWIRENLPGAHVSGGVSNLSFAFRGNNYIREAMHAVFLYHAIQAGMDFGIVNPATKVAYEDIPADQLEIIEDVILNRKPKASDRLIALAEQVKRHEDSAKDNKQGVSHAEQDQWRLLPLKERLMYALRKGLPEFLEQDLSEALTQYDSAVEIIEQPLMEAMNMVGELFGQGKMFLPQVVKSARTMKMAVQFLQPFIEAQRQNSKSSAGRVVLATVKGDVHDIGKNIVAVIMACNNYEVIDMGVMVPAEQIVKKAIEVKADIIGLSGLITPSLEEMVNVAGEMEKAGLNIPILIGGATTSELHVALKIAPVYHGPVAWMKDASQNPIAAAKLIDPEQHLIVEEKLKKDYEALRKGYENNQQSILGIEEARKRKPNLFDNGRNGNS